MGYSIYYDVVYYIIFVKNNFAPAKLNCRICLVPILFAFLDTSSGSSTQEPAPCLPEQSVNNSHLPLGM